ncbi:hydroxyethylthiazole kinase [Gracilibacillus ureilyticus]|uniref:Hydroxyethylthiazole kinase n=1 Tax=Gracilibacillus ureilyticus TaxID=531814 RepID=A0A1H9NMF7_9BACI|nr:hydroxyethylthiazole kinase [Gracilibacillus ureilyticus]SER36819.1 hydroxyethylthiazole kinase [Gracilibacillus ureilyticus]
MTRFLERIRTQKPLIHNITNVVVTNFTANGLYAAGASPVMANAKEEVEEMASIANALVLNIGTLSSEQVESMIIAGKAANKAGIPVVLDPVGVGATSFRTESARTILEQVNVSAIRGNVGEIANLAGLSAQVRGVDSMGEFDMDELLSMAYKKIQVPLAVTGELDFITDGKEKAVISNGHPLLTKVTGAGCLLSSVVAAFLAVEKDVFHAVTGAVCYYGIAAEEAASKAKLPGDFQIELLNQLYAVSDDLIAEKSRSVLGKLGSDL